MKYIGNKTRLLDFIELSLKDSQVDFSNKKVLDLFAGTGAVSLFFKSNNCNVTSVDFMTLSVCNLYYYNYFNSEPDFPELYNDVGSKTFLDVFNYLVTINNEQDSYYFDNYAPSGFYKRQYFTDENARKIDNYFNNLSKFKERLSSEKYLFLVGAGINAFDRVANIAGTYGAYLKIWRSMALKNIVPLGVNYISNGTNKIVKDDVINFLNNHEHFDIVYMDPPYNERQYAPNFHVLENLACNDKPILEGKTGIRPYKNQVSKFCSRRDVVGEFSKLISMLETKTFILSYSTEGIMSFNEIKSILESKFKTVNIYKKSYKRFKTNGWTDADTGLKELLFVCKN